MGHPVGLVASLYGGSPIQVICSLFQKKKKKKRKKKKD